MSGVLPSLPDLTFTGNDGEECEHFINAVRRQARIHEKLRDDEWITDLVSSSVVGDALRWHAELSPEVSGNWRKLQQALLDRYPSKGEANSNPKPYEFS